MDEGRFKARRAIVLGSFLDYAAFQALFVWSSADMYFLQLADFAAFAINRIQWLLAKEERTDKDDILLQILVGAQLNVVNLPVQRIDLSKWSVGDFDAFHREDRMKRGLPPQPGTKRSG